jgi:Legionella pneumophila major outer membrane protein precursor
MRKSYSRSSLAAGMLVMVLVAGARAAEPEANLLKPAPAATQPIETLPIKDLTPPELANPTKENDRSAVVQPPGAPSGDADAQPSFLELVGGMFELGPTHEGVFYGAAEYLSMTPRQRGLDYAIVDPKNDLVPQGQVQSLTFEDRSGLRITLGCQLPGSGWDLGITYTGIDGKGSQAVGAPTAGLIYPETTRPGLTDNALSAAASVRLEYNIFDLTFARNLQVDPCLQVRLATGLRFASIHENLDAFYNGMLADNAATQSRSTFTGAGPMFGSELCWRLGHGFGLFGGANCGLIYGNMRASQIETNNGGATLYADVTDKSRQMIPFAGFALGMSWEYRGVTVRAGYEAVNWFGLIERLNLSNDFSEGKLIPQQNDLSIDGFFVQMAYRF